MPDARRWRHGRGVLAWALAAGMVTAPAQAVVINMAVEPLPFTFRDLEDPAHADAFWRDLRDQFEAEHPGVTLAIQLLDMRLVDIPGIDHHLQTGEGLDVVFTRADSLRGHYLDLRPFLDDPAGWERDFGFPLRMMRLPGDEQGLRGAITHVELTGAYINASMFAVAGVRVPDYDPAMTWDDWADLVHQVGCRLDDSHALAAALGFAQHIDTLGQLALAEGSDLGLASPEPTTAPPYRKMAARIDSWVRTGLVPPEYWGNERGFADEDYPWVTANPVQLFERGHVVMVMAPVPSAMAWTARLGTWQDMEWLAIGNPCGAGGCSGVGEAWAYAGMRHTAHPAAVADVLAFLAREDNLEALARHYLLVPAHRELLRRGVDYGRVPDPNLPPALAVLGQEALKLSEPGLAFSAAPAARQEARLAQIRIGQAVVGPLNTGERSHEASQGRLMLAADGELDLEGAFNLIDEDREWYRQHPERFAALVASTRVAPEVIGTVPAGPGRRPVTCTPGTGA